MNGNCPRWKLSNELWAEIVLGRDYLWKLDGNCPKWKLLDGFKGKFHWLKKIFQKIACYFLSRNCLLKFLRKCFLFYSGGNCLAKKIQKIFFISGSNGLSNVVYFIIDGNCLAKKKRNKINYFTTMCSLVLIEIAFLKQNLFLYCIVKIVFFVAGESCLAKIELSLLHC